MDTISQDSFLSVLESFNITTCTVDANARIINYSQNFLTMFGYKHKEVLQQPLSLLHIDEESYQDFLKHFFLPLLDDANNSCSAESTTFVSSSKDRLLCKFSLHKITDNKIIVSIQDSQLLDNEKLQSMYKEISSLEKTKQYYLEASIKKTQHIKKRDSVIVNQAKLAAMGEMIGAIAHQWKQPLSKINSILLDMQRLFPPNKEREILESRLDDIEELTLHMADTIEDFRSYINPQKEKTLFTFSEVLSDAQKILSSTISIHKIQFEIKFLDNITLYGYKKEFIQSLLIFFNNSKDAFHANSINEKKIKITTREINNNKIIRIEDNAGGIRPEILPNVFEPYFSTKKDQGGTGLGLYMAKLLLEDNMNCKLKINSIHEKTEISIIFLGLKSDK